MKLLINKKDNVILEKSLPLPFSLYVLEKNLFFDTLLWGKPSFRLPPQ